MVTLYEKRNASKVTRSTITHLIFYTQYIIPHFSCNEEQRQVVMFIIVEETFTLEPQRTLCTEILIKCIRYLEEKIHVLSTGLQKSSSFMFTKLVITLEK